MRVIVVGRHRHRRALRGALEDSVLQIVGEFESLAAARRASVRADAVLMSYADGDEEEEEAWTEALTARETEVLELVALGLSNKRIAERLGISDQTVKFHVASISGKLGGANRTDVVRRAVRRGLITL